MVQQRYNVNGREAEFDSVEVEQTGEESRRKKKEVGRTNRSKNRRSSSRPVLRDKIVPRIVDLVHCRARRHLHAARLVVVVAVVFAHATAVHHTHLLVLGMLLRLMAWVMLLLLKMLWMCLSEGLGRVRAIYQIIMLLV